MWKFSQLGAGQNSTHFETDGKELHAATNSKLQTTFPLGIPYYFQDNNPDRENGTSPVALYLPCNQELNAKTALAGA